MVGNRAILISVALLVAVFSAHADSPAPRPKTLVLKRPQAAEQQPPQAQTSLTEPTEAPFSFVGITLADNLNTVVEKLKQSGITLHNPALVTMPVSSANLLPSGSPEMLHSSAKALVVTVNLEAPWSSGNFYFLQDRVTSVGYRIISRTMPLDEDSLSTNAIYRKLVERFGEPDSKDLLGLRAVWNRARQRVTFDAQKALNVLAGHSEGKCTVRFVNLGTIEYLNALDVQEKATQRRDAKSVLDKF